MDKTSCFRLVISVSSYYLLDWVNYSSKYQRKYKDNNFGLKKKTAALISIDMNENTKIPTLGLKLLGGFEFS